MYSNSTLILLKLFVNATEHRRVAYIDPAMNELVRKEADKRGLFQSRHEITVRSRSSSPISSWLHESDSAVKLELAPIGLVRGPSVVCVRSTLDPSKLLCTPATATPTQA